MPRKTDFTDNLKYLIMNDYRYKLETPRVTGRRQQKYQCPHCGRKSLVRYVDTYDGCSYVADAVGKCDHQNSCGYHYKPKEYFEDHAWLKEKVVHYHQPKPLPPPPPLQPLPMELVGQYHSPDSTLWDWLKTACAEKLHIDPKALQQVYKDYHIGATPQRNVIFWQIDEQQRVRSGHIMRYRQDGHRQGYQNWVHSELLKGRLPEGWVLYQCLFGAHLLPQRPEARVAIVEGEKTAVVMAAKFPQYIWLATGSCNGLTPEKLQCLKGRRVTLFPDSGCYGKWKEIMEGTQGLDYNISGDLEAYPKNADIVDLLMGEV